MIIVKKDQDPIGHIENVIPNWHVDIFHDANPDNVYYFSDGRLLVKHQNGNYSFAVPFLPFAAALESVDFEVRDALLLLMDEVKESLMADLMMIYTFVGDCVEGGFNSEFLPEPFQLEADPMEWFLKILSKAFESWITEYTGGENTEVSTTVDTFQMEDNRA